MFLPFTRDIITTPVIGETLEEKSVKTNLIIVKNGGKEQMAYYDAPEISKFYRCYDYGMTPRL